MLSNLKCLRTGQNLFFFSIEIKEKVFCIHKYRETRVDIMYLPVNSKRSATQIWTTEQNVEREGGREGCLCRANRSGKFTTPKKFVWFLKYSCRILEREKQYFQFFNHIYFLITLSYLPILCNI